MRLRWSIFLLPPVLVSLLLFVAPQLAFLRSSFLQSLPYGRIGSEITSANYWSFLTDSFYLRALVLTMALSFSAVLFSIVLAFPVAYGLARWHSPWRSFWLTLLVAASLITVVIKVLGLMVLLSPNGPINWVLLHLHLIDQPLRLLNNDVGAIIGLVHYTLPLAILVLFSVVQTIPENLESAARSLGASSWRAIWRVVVPLSVPGLTAAGLMAFNLAMGTFTSTALLGGGKVLTLPILVERKAILEVNYPFAATISMILLLSGILVNAAVFFIARRFQRSRTEAA